MLDKALLILLILLCSTIVYADQKIVKIATLGDYAPYCMADKDVKLNQIIPVGSDAKGFKGYSWDVVRESFHKMGYTIYLSISPWIRAVNYIKNGEADVLFPTGMNSARKKIYKYSKSSINKANFLVYVPIESKFKWDGIKSLEGLRLGFVRGYNFGDKLKKVNIDLSDLNSMAHGFIMLDKKRIDGFLGYEYNWDYFLIQNNTKTKYRKLPVFDSSSEYLIALKRNRNGDKIIKDFDKGNLILEKKGRIAEIKRKWFGK